MTYPRDRIKTLLLIGWFVDVVYVPAWLLVGLWIVTQVVSQAGAAAGVQDSGVAYMAHVGGAAFGVICARWFETRSAREAGAEPY